MGDSKSPWAPAPSYDSKNRFFLMRGNGGERAREVGEISISLFFFSLSPSVSLSLSLSLLSHLVCRVVKGDDFPSRQGPARERPFRVRGQPEDGRALQPLDALEESHKGRGHDKVLELDVRAVRGEHGRGVEVERGLLREGPGEVEGRGEELGVGGRGGPPGDEELLLLLLLV